MTRILLHISIVTLYLIKGATPGRADEPDAVQLAISELKLARSYKYTGGDTSAEKFFHAVGGDAGNKERLPTAATYKDLVANYEKPLKPIQDPTGRAPRELFRSAIRRLTAIANENPLAPPLLRDAIAEYIEGESLLGNDKLIKALRSRFPGNDDHGTPPTPEEQLVAANENFQFALDALRVLSQYPMLLRDGTSDGADNPLGLVENSDHKVVLNELNVAVSAIERRARTGVELGKLLFNNSAAGQERRTPDAIAQARADAAETLKQAGQEGYLWLATAAALHAEPGSFSRNGAGEVRSQLATAERVYGTILRGDNPDGYVKEFIPSRPTDRLYRDAVTAVIQANLDENRARRATRELDDSLATLRGELLRQRETYRNALQDLCGVDVLDNGDIRDKQTNTLLNIDIGKTEGRQKFMNYVRDTINGNLRYLFEQMLKDGSLDPGQTDLSLLPVVPAARDIKPQGQIAVQLLELRAANLALLTQVQEFKSFAERIQNEEIRVGKVAQVVTQSYGTMGAKEIAMGWANAVTVSTIFPAVGLPSVSVNFNPGSIVSGYLQRDISNIQAEMTVQIEGANSEAVVKNLLIDQRRAFTAVRSAENRVIQARVGLENLLSTAEQRLDDWATSRQEAAEIYFNYPQFRVEREEAVVRAEDSFQRAREECYFSAKALQYEWVEAYSNPIPVSGTANGASLPRGFERFSHIESVFGARDTLELKDFLLALKAWQTLLSTDGRRGNPREEIGFSPLISVRQTLWGYDDHLKANDQSASEIRERNIAMFQQRLKENLIRRESDGAVIGLAFEFKTEIDSNRMFASNNEWNQKILGVGVGLNFKDSLGVTFPAVELTQGGVSSLRKFPPEDRNIERMSLSGLGTNQLEDAIRHPAAQRTYRKITNVLLNPTAADFRNDPVRNLDTGLAELSVAADRWTLHIDLDDPANAGMRLDQLTDIVLIFHYSFNHPADAVVLLSKQLHSR